MESKESMPVDMVNTSEEAIQLHCRFYEQRFPEIDELVMVNVRSIAEMGAYVSLLEYNNIEGMIMLSELSRRRMRSINKHIRVGKNEVVMVLRVDKEKGYIDLSKRRVDPEDILKCEDRYNKAKTVHGVLRQVAQHEKVPLEDLYRNVAWPLYKKFKTEKSSEDEKRIEYMHCYDVFRMGITDARVFDGLELTDKVKQQLMNQVERRLTPQPIKIRSDIEVTCFTYEGIEAIRVALSAAQDSGSEDVPVKVKLIAPPMYVMATVTLDKLKGIETLNAAIEIIRKEIGARGGTLNVKMEPKVVSLHEESELNLMMERLELENRQVDGDTAEDD